MAKNKRPLNFLVHFENSGPAKQYYRAIQRVFVSCRAICKCTGFIPTSTSSNYFKPSPSTHLRPRFTPSQVFCRGFNESEYTGFDVSLFRDAALRAGLGSAGNGYNFKCLPTFQGMLLNTLQGTCDIALSSITITVEREQLGLQFTYPYLASYLGIMVATTGEKVAGWNWTQPFSWDLWLATAVTLMIFPFCVVLIEFGSLKDKIRPKDCIRGNIESTSRSLWTMVSCGLTVRLVQFPTCQSMDP